MIHTLRMAVCAPFRLLYVLFRRAEDRPWHRCTVRDLCLLTVAYAILFAVWSPILKAPDCPDWREVLAKIGLLEARPERKECSSGLRQLGLLLRQYNTLHQGDAAPVPATAASADE